ncbi:twin-arginine translocase TatA/TatE family subunit [candidate division KSB1 bacterium]|nr:twin-arginine translocase TatA/TatE family subunit [candidate division KSB1 bacterium]
MFGSIGMTELLTILLLVLILFGPKRIPELARSLGKGLNELRRAAEDVKNELDLNDIDKQPERLSKPLENQVAWGGETPDKKETEANNARTN